MAFSHFKHGGNASMGVGFVRVAGFYVCLHVTAHGLSLRMSKHLGPGPMNMNEHCLHPALLLFFT
jgi:hypothetical protein